MACCGLGDPCIDQMEVGLTGDENTRDMKSLFRIAYDNESDRWMSKRELLQIVRGAETDTELFDWFNPDDRGKQTKFGKLLVSFQDRELGGLRMELDRKDPSRVRYRFVETSQTPSSTRESTLLNSVCEPGEHCELVPDTGGVVLPMKDTPYIGGLQVSEVSEVRNSGVQGNPMPCPPTVPDSIRSHPSTGGAK